MTDSLSFPYLNIGDITFFFLVEDGPLKAIISEYSENSEPPANKHIFKIYLTKRDQFFDLPANYERTYEHSYYYRWVGGAHYLWGPQFFGYIDPALQIGRLFLGPENQPFIEPYLRFCSAWALLLLDGFIFHSAGLAIDGSGLLFPAQSESGKSTIVDLSAGLASALCDEMNVARKKDGVWHVWGTPFWGSAVNRDKSYRGFPLKAILFPHRDSKFWLKECKRPQAIEGLLNNVLLFGHNPEAGKRALDLACELAEAVPAYDFGFARNNQLIPYLKENFVSKI
jgi:hypothetical protein